MLFFFDTDLVLSRDESMHQARNGKSWINDLCLSWSSMIDCLYFWLLLHIKIYIKYKWLWIGGKKLRDFSNDIVQCNTVNVISSDSVLQKIMMTHDEFNDIYQIKNIFLLESLIYFLSFFMPHPAPSLSITLKSNRQQLIPIFFSY